MSRNNRESFLIPTNSLRLTQKSLISIWFNSSSLQLRSSGILELSAGFNVKKSCLDDFRSQFTFWIKFKFNDFPFSSFWSRSISFCSIFQFFNSRRFSLSNRFNSQRSSWKFEMDRRIYQFLERESRENQKRNRFGWCQRRCRKERL